MKQTPNGTAVGVDDPYDHVDRCDHLTDDGRCRFAIERASDDLAFARERECEDYRCHVGEAENWSACRHFRCRNRNRECQRCGLEERWMAHSEEQPLLEEHHLSYADEADLGDEITIYLCRWCHAKVHGSWARVGDDVNPDTEAIAAAEDRRSKELAEADFTSAAERL